MTEVVREVAVLIYPGVELLDFAGPAEVFIVSNEGKSFQVSTVAEQSSPLQTMGGIILTPEYSIETAPQPDVLVIPGGNLDAVSDRTLEWVQQAAGEAEIVMSVCTGAFLLGKVGLLENLEATTHSSKQEELAAAVPSCTVARDQRFVDCGKIITTAGVTAGIDASLHVVSRLLGEEAAQWTASEWMEYSWNSTAS